MICCVCENKCEKALRQLIREGCDTVEKLREEHGVSGHCGICEPYVQGYIDDEKRLTNERTSEQQNQETD